MKVILTITLGGRATKEVEQFVKGILAAIVRTDEKDGDWIVYSEDPNLDTEVAIDIAGVINFHGEQAIEYLKSFLKVSRSARQYVHAATRPAAPTEEERFSRTYRSPEGVGPRTIGQPLPEETRTMVRRDIRANSGPTAEILDVADGRTRIMMRR